MKRTDAGYEFTTEEIRYLGEMERRMDRGEVPFVMVNSRRVAITHDAVTEFGLEQGQTITREIFIAVLNFQIATLVARIAVNKAVNSASTRAGK